MTKRNVTEATDQAIQPVTRLTPAVVIGNSTKMEIAQSVLPKEFQGVELETIDSGFCPTVKWEKAGSFVGGVFSGMKSDVGPNRSMLYEFDVNGQTFGIWGGKVLDSMFEDGMKNGQIAFGRKMLVIYMGDVETDQNPCRLYQIKVMKPK